MEDISVTGIVLNSMPYREKDRLVHIFSLELGNITGILKGVSAPNSKLKFAGQPFCFGKFDLTMSKDFYIVKGVDMIDSFFDVTLDYDVYKFSSSLLEICNLILKPNIISESLFLYLLKTLQNIVYNGIDYKISVIKFYLGVLQTIGYKLNFDVCDNCQMKFVGDIKFDIESGSFRCSTCSNYPIISKQDFISLKIIQDCLLEKLATIKIKEDCKDRILEMMILDIQNKLNTKLKSIAK